MANKKRTINLLEPINPPSDIWTTIYNWVFRVGRYLLVGIEILLLGVFFARFTMDEINNNLTEDINDQISVLSNKEFRTQEIQYRNIQTLLYDVDSLKKDQPINSSTIAEVISGVPNKLTMNSFSFNKGRVSLNISALDIKAVRDYEFSLRQNTKYSAISMTVSKNENDSSILMVSISFNIIENTSGKGS